MVDIVKERNTFLTASTGTEVKESLINLITAVNNGWVLGCDGVDDVMNDIRQHPKLDALMMLHDMKYVGRYAFRECPFITSIDLPSAEVIDFGAFHSCPHLIDVGLPNARVIGQQAFLCCSMISTINLPAAEEISNAAFMSCSSLASVTLGWSSVCYISNNAVFMRTPIASGTGRIYVPSELVSAYRADPVWSFYSSAFRSIHS